MRILVTGSRDWDDRLAIYRALNAICEEFGLNYPPDEYGNTMPDPSRFTLVHGHCPTGADHWADEWCIGNNFLAERHAADWSRGRRAGPERNGVMVTTLDADDLCVAFIGNCTSPRCNLPGDHPSHGATGCASLAEKAGIPTRRYFA